MMGRDENEIEYCIYCGVDADQPHDTRCFLVRGEIEGAYGLKNKPDNPEWNAQLSRTAILMAWTKEGLSSGDKKRDERLAYEQAKFFLKRNDQQIYVLGVMLEELREKLNHPIKRYFTRGLEKKINELIESIPMNFGLVIGWCKGYKVSERKIDDVTNHIEESKGRYEKVLSTLHRS